MTVRQNRIVLVVGAKGSGKSYWLKRKLDKLGRHSPVVIWDHTCEYAGRDAADAIKNAQALDLRTFLARQAAQEGHLGRVAIQDHPERFCAFCGYVARAGGMTVVLDELHVHARFARKCRAFWDLVYTSRHRRLNIYAVAWRPTSIPPELRAVADEIRFFRTQSDLDLEWAAKNASPQLANRLSSLPVGRSLSWSPGG